MTRRSYVPLPERLAATLACLLPQEQRDDLRRRKAKAEAVLALFHFDHVIFHAHGGADKWWNLDPKLVAEHREKTAKIDVPAIAKGKRITRANEEFFRRLLAKSEGPQSMFVAGKWVLVSGLDMQSPKRKWASRPFPKTGRKIANRRKA
jgi:hypothetical protein